MMVIQVLRNGLNSIAAGLKIATATVLSKVGRRLKTPTGSVRIRLFAEPGMGKK